MLMRAHTICILVLLMSSCGKSPQSSAERQKVIDAKAAIKASSASVALFHKAVEANDISGVMAQLAADGSLLNAPGKEKRTALCWAVRAGHLEMAGYLIAQGADLTVEPRYGDNPLLGAARLGHLEIVRKLLAAGDDINRDIRGGTALGSAAHSGHLDVVKLLLTKGTKIDAGATANGGALHSVAMRGHIELAGLLCDAGATINIMDKHGVSP
jgi:uncharacterized protein